MTDETKQTNAIVNHNVNTIIDRHDWKPNRRHTETKIKWSLKARDRTMVLQLSNLI